MNDFVEIDFKGSKLPVTKILYELLTSYTKSSEKSLGEYDAVINMHAPY